MVSFWYFLPNIDHTTLSLCCAHFDRSTTLRCSLRTFDGCVGPFTWIFSKLLASFDSPKVSFSSRRRDLLTRESVRTHVTYRKGLVLILGHIVVHGPFYYHGLTLLSAWINNYIHYKVWDKISYPFLNFNGATVRMVPISLHCGFEILYFSCLILLHCVIVTSMFWF